GRVQPRRAPRMLLILLSRLLWVESRYASTAETGERRQHYPRQQLVGWEWAPAGSWITESESSNWDNNFACIGVRCWYEARKSSLYMENRRRICFFETDSRNAAGHYGSEARLHICFVAFSYRS